MKSGDSFFDLWFDVFPGQNKCSTFLFDDQEELEMLESTIYNLSIEKYKQLITMDYKILTSEIPEIEDELTLFEYRKMTIIVKCKKGG